MKLALADLIQKQLQDSLEAKKRLCADPEIAEKIRLVAEKCIEAYRKGNKTLFAGNGGSAADAQHLAAEFVSRFAFDRPGLPSIALSTDTSMITAIGNDYGYENLFKRQVQAQAKAGDVFFGFSTSGKSPNILCGLEEAGKMGVFRVGMTGATSGQMAALCDICINVPSTETPRIQECHILIGHIICAAVEETLFERP